MPIYFAPLSLGLFSDNLKEAPGLVAPGMVVAPLTIARGQVAGVLSTSSGPDGVGVQTYGGNVPRFNGTARRLLIEGQRTNNITHPVGVGGAPWYDTGVGGTTWSVVGGRPGSPAGTSDVTRITAEAAALLTRWTPAAATAGSLSTMSAYVRRSPEATTNQGFAFIADNPFGFGPNFVATANWQRFAWSFTPGAASINVGISRDSANGAYDIEVWGVQLETGGFASSLILPPAGAPAASTRGTDLVTAPLASLGVAGNGAGTYLWSGVIPSADGNMRLMSVSDGTLANYYGIMLSGATLFPVRVASSSFAAAGSSVVSAGVPFRAGFTLDGAGRIAASLNGQPAVSISGGPTAGLIGLDVGSVLSAEPMFGETAVCRVIPGAVDDATLQTLVAGLPT